MSEVGLVDEVEEEAPGLCPCCHERPALPGLYSRVNNTDMPLILRVLKSSAPEMEVRQLHPDMWDVLGRYFVMAYAGMPLGRRESPIRITTWIELDSLTANRLLDAMSGYGEALEAGGKLAADLPGFPGSLGADITFQAFPGDAAELLTCEDPRVKAIPADLDHDKMAALYRYLWGSRTYVPDADLGLRAAVNRHWHEHLGRPFFRRAVTPPPMIAGIRPPEVLISPPLDTNDPALLATVGCSEHEDSNGELIEIVTQVRNPTEECIDSFAMFSWFSRVQKGLFGAGVAICEQKGIPGAREGMFGWLLADPRFLPESAWRVQHDGKTVRIVEAIPVDRPEVSYLQMEGFGALESLLDAVDTSDLTRDSTSPLADA